MSTMYFKAINYKKLEQEGVDLSVLQVKKN